jgi:uncharacterized membrane protein YkgB
MESDVITRRDVNFPGCILQSCGISIVRLSIFTAMFHCSAAWVRHEVRGLRQAILNEDPFNCFYYVAPPVAAAVGHHRAIVKW